RRAPCRADAGLLRRPDRGHHRFGPLDGAGETDCRQLRGCTVAGLMRADALGPAARPEGQVNPPTGLEPIPTVEDGPKLSVRVEEFAPQNRILLDTGAGATLRACSLAQTPISKEQLRKVLPGRLA